MVLGRRSTEDGLKTKIYFIDDNQSQSITVEKNDKSIKALKLATKQWI